MRTKNIQSFLVLVLCKQATNTELQVSASSLWLKFQARQHGWKEMGNGDLCNGHFSQKSGVIRFASGLRDQNSERDRSFYPP